jgi:DNA (cytosine-5)-methyltransferase 1
LRDQRPIVPAPVGAVEPASCVDQLRGLRCSTMSIANPMAIIGNDSLDVIVGGPPCPGFSTARQRDGSNHGDKRLKEDPRRHLFRNFLNFVDFFQPKVFVIENVLGLRSASGGHYFTAVQYEARILGRDSGRAGYRVHPQIERGDKLGAPQKRRRQLIVGVRADLAACRS